MSLQFALENRLAANFVTSAQHFIHIHSGNPQRVPVGEDVELVFNDAAKLWTTHVNHMEVEQHPGKKVEELIPQAAALSAKISVERELAATR